MEKQTIGEISAVGPASTENFGVTTTLGAKCGFCFTNISQLRSEEKTFLNVVEEREIMKQIGLLRSIQIRIIQKFLLKLTWLFYATTTRTVKIVKEFLSAHYHIRGFERSLIINWVLQAKMQNVL